MTGYHYDEDFYKIYFPVPGTIEPGVIETVVRNGLSSGWTTRRDGTTDVCHYYGTITDERGDQVPTEDAVRDLDRNHSGSLTVFGTSTDFSFRVIDPYDGCGIPDVPTVILSWERVHLREEVEETVTEIFETATLVFEHLPVPFAFSRIPKDLEYETEVTKGHLKNGQIPDVHWLTLLSEQVCKAIGRSRVETAPVWKVEPLNSGGIGFVVTGSPFDYRSEDKRRVRDHLGLKN